MLAYSSKHHCSRVHTELRRHHVTSFTAVYSHLIQPCQVIVTLNKRGCKNIYIYNISKNTYYMYILSCLRVNEPRFVEHRGKVQGEAQANPWDQNTLITLAVTHTHTHTHTHTTHTTERGSRCRQMQRQKIPPTQTHTHSFRVKQYRSRSLPTATETHTDTDQTLSTAFSSNHPLGLLKMVSTT